MTSETNEGQNDEGSTMNVKSMVTSENNDIDEKHD